LVKNPLFLLQSSPINDLHHDVQLPCQFNFIFAPKNRLSAKIAFSVEKPARSTLVFFAILFDFIFIL